MTKKKKTCSIEPYQHEFLDETGLEASLILRNRIDEVIAEMTEARMRELKKEQLKTAIRKAVPRETCRPDELESLLIEVAREFKEQNN